MTRLLMSGVAVAALLAFGTTADAQQQQQPTYQTQPSQGGGGGAGTGASTKVQEETQPGKAQQKSSEGTTGGTKKMEKKTGQAEGSADKTNTKKMEKKTGQAEGSADKTNTKKMEKKTGQTESSADKTKKTESESSGATGATGGNVDIPEGKRGQVAKSFSSHKVKHADVDIDVSVGIAVPSTVVLYPVPADVIRVVPAFRHYRYFVLANGEIVIVDPASLVIVYVLTV